MGQVIFLPFQTLAKLANKWLEKFEDQQPEYRRQPPEI